MNTRLQNSPRAKLQSSSGYTLTEALVTLVLVTLVTAAMATGVAFASRQYVNSAAVSEAKVLESTLASVISNELEMTSQVVIEGAGDDPKKLDSFFSRNYGEKDGFCSFRTISITKPDKDSATNAAASITVLPEGTPGEIALGIDSYTTGGSTPVTVPGHWNRIISSAAYTHGNKADVEVRYFEGSEPPHFSVNLTIYNEAGGNIIDSSFDVIPLNQVTVQTK